MISFPRSEFNNLRIQYFSQAQFSIYFNHHKIQGHYQNQEIYYDEFNHEYTAYNLLFGFNNMQAEPSSHQVKPRTGENPVLTILWDPHRPDTSPLDPNRIEDIMFDATESVRTYFEVNSGDKFTITNAGIMGPYDSQKPWTHYWEDHNSTTKAQGCNSIPARQEGWIGGHSERWAEAVRKADTEINFSQYDRNRDGTLQPSELGILIVIPRSSGESGYVRSLDGRQCPSHQPFRTNDGIIIPEIAEWFTDGNRTRYSTSMHELAHHLLDTLDMYNTSEAYVRPGKISLMANNPGNTSHLDAFNKLLLGWIKPRSYHQNGVYHLRSVGSSYPAETLVLPRSGSLDKEYFLIEFREDSRGGDRGILFDYNIGDTGLAVWHIIEDSSLNRVAPRDISQDYWDENAHHLFSRGVRLIRPVRLLREGQSTSAWHNNSLWGDEDNPIESNVTDPYRGRLEWSDGTPSGYEISHIQIYRSNTNREYPEAVFEVDYQ